MLTLHHLNDSRSQRILWLLEELGLPYEIKRYQRDIKTRLIHSASRPSLPMVTVGSRNPVRLSITSSEPTARER
jgi:hypothetical protein